jgi:hypothetical protein
MNKICHSDRVLRLSFKTGKSDEESKISHIRFTQFEMTLKNTEY